MKKVISILIVIFAISTIVFGQVKKPTPKPTASTTTQNKYSDFVISQEIEMGDGKESMTSSSTKWVKGVRDREQSKMSLPPGLSSAEAAMMEQMMGNMAQPITLKQCDLKQTVSINDSKKTYFIDYDDWSSVPPEKLKMRPNRKPIVIKGTMTSDSVVVDSGKRQMMFGYEAKWLTWTTTVEVSADSCMGKNSIKFEEEGWFIRVSLNEESCKVNIPRGDTGGCIPKMIIKSSANPGFLLEGTRKMWDKGKLGMTMKVKTKELSKAPLDQALFEIPKGYTEVDSMSELGGVTGPVDNSATTVFETSENEDDKTQTKMKGKTIAIDFFSGNSSKVNQDELRQFISSKLSSAGMNGFLATSQADIQNGNFVNVIGVELKKIKESGAAKVGGLFGKVTGTSDAAKLGDTEAEIVINIYGKDGKTVVATATATEKIKGSPNDAVKAAISKIIDGLLAKIK